MWDYSAASPLNPLSRSSRESTRTLCKRFASVSPDLSGHGCQTDRAPMLVGTPFAVKLSVFGALGRELWISRVLVRSQEGQLSRATLTRGAGLGSSRSPRQRLLRRPHRV